MHEATNQAAGVKKRTTAQRLDDIEDRLAKLEERNAEIDRRAAETLNHLRTAVVRREIARPEFQEQLATAVVQGVSATEQNQ